jgi:uncharacterized damage-inducible protein DinB
LAKTLLDEALEGWAYTRDGVIAELENIPADKFDASPAPGVRTVAEIARHIVEAGTVMAGELSRPDGNFTRQGYPDFLKEYAGGLDRRQDKASLIALMRSTLEDGSARIRKAGDAHMAKPILQFNGEPAARLSWMSHGVAHEEYHRGQLTLHARLLGLVPALTKLIHGE